VSIQAWATQDIRTAVFLAEEMAREEMGQLDLIVDAAAEAWREPDLLVRVGAAVVLPPFPDDGRTTDGALLPLDCAKVLHDLGVPVALSAHGDSSTTASLAHQAGHAMRGGLPFDAALAAVTITPARLYGVDDRLGSIEVGKDGDLVLWNGTPFEPASRVVGVLVQGELIVDPRDATDQQDQ
jgi:imidazolonepropionase-like amidohydrolase